LGVYKDYVRYMVVIGPDFPKEIERFTMQFRHMTGGIKLSFYSSSNARLPRGEIQRESDFNP